MYIFSGNDVNDLYPAVCGSLLHAGRDVGSRVSMTKELHPVTMRVNNPLRRLITSYGRPVNPAFALAEVLWILSGSNEVAMLEWYNSTIGNYSDDGTTFNAAYGSRLKSHFGFDQLRDVIRNLKENPDTRQAVLNIWSPKRDRAFILDLSRIHSSQLKKNETKDRACNLMSHLMIRDGKLDWMQIMRSNDVIWGTPNNFMQWMHIMEYVAGSIGVPVGNYWHISDSLHVYDYHLKELQGIEFFDLYEELEQDHKPINYDEDVIATMIANEYTARAVGKDAMGPEEEEVGEYWYSVFGILKAWALYKRGQDREAMLELSCCADDVLGAAQWRFFYHWRWHKPQYSDLLNSQLLNRDGIYTDRVKMWIIQSSQDS